MLVSILEILSQELRILLNRADVISSRVKDYYILRESLRLCLLLPKSWEVLIKCLHIFSRLLF